MFDVDWTDPDTERVGERRARKEIERDAKRKDEARNVRESVSSRSSLSSVDKTTGFLGGLALKIGTTSLRSKRASPRPSILPLSTSRKRASILSQLAAAESTMGSHDSAIVVDDDPILPIQGVTVCSPPVSEKSRDRSSKDSVLSKSTEATMASSPPPFLKPITSPVFTLHGSIDFPTTNVGIKQLADEMLEQNFNSNSTKQNQVSPSKTPKYTQSLPRTIITGQEMSASLLIHEWFTSVHGASGPATPVEDKPTSPRKNSLSTYDLKPPGNLSRSPSRTATLAKRPSFPTPTKIRIQNTRSWRSPDTWDANSANPDTPSATSMHGSPIRDQGVVQSPMSTLDLHAVQREMAKMAAASPHIISVRLKEDWGSSVDASFYKELEMEKQRWMLSALRTLNKPAIDSSINGGEGQKILALYESQATTSYLAGLHPKAILTHLAAMPLSSTLFPNVQPMLAPVRAVLPMESNSYTAAYCLCLPSLMAGRDIPKVLRSIHRCLAPKGILHLTLIDPSPASQSVGPLMRHWLDQNLLLNLEARFRCISPSRLFPAWLADARLRANGSIITTVKFNAINQPSREIGDGTAKVEELRSTVGRKLWQEVWGKFVHGSSWWWDDAACVEECLRLGTYFEYNLIEAVKDTI